MIRFGNRSDFAVHVLPLAGAPSDPDPAAAATWVALEIWVAGQNLSAHTHDDSGAFHTALHWPAIYMARWLVDSWPELYGSSRWPIRAKTHPRTAAELLAEWDHELVQGDESDEELDRRDAFLASHCLATAAAGGLAPPLYLSRDAGGMRLAWDAGDDPDGVSFQRPRGEALVSAVGFARVVHQFVEWVHDQLVTRAASDADRLRFAEWLALFEGPEAADELLCRFAGVAGKLRDRLGLTSVSALMDFFRLPEGWRSRGVLADPEQSAIAVAFRCVSPEMTVDDLQSLRQNILTAPRGSAGFAALERLALTAGPADARRRDYEQGYRLAESVRAALDNADGYLDVERLLGQLGVAIGEFDLSDPHLDGASVCDADHGPVVFVNRRSQKALTPWGRRMLLAHEFCHLLFDRDAARPLAVVSGPWAPAGLERQANAFAAELLLPRKGMLEILRANRRQTPLDDDVQAFMDLFQVGLTTASWQAENRLGFGY